MGEFERALEISDDQVDALLAGKWAGWADAHPGLHPANAGDAKSLRKWLSEADRSDHDPVLRCLAQIAASDGDDDTDAARLLAWVMRPAAMRLLRELGPIAERLEERLAAGLWIEVRTCPWQASFPIAANLARRLRRRVVGDASAELPQQLSPTELDDVWRLAEAKPAQPADHVSSSMRLLDVLERGCQEGVITEADRELLLDVIATATDLAEWHGFGAVSLIGDRVSDALSNQWRVSGRTIRRRTNRSIEALAEMVASAA